MVLLYHSWIYTKRNQKQRTRDIHHTHPYCCTIHSSQDTDQPRCLWTRKMWYMCTAGYSIHLKQMKLGHLQENGED